MSLFQNYPERFFAESGGSSHRCQIGSGGVCGVEAGEPVAAVAQQVVAHFAVGFHVVGEGEVMQPEHEGDIHLLRSVVPFREVQGEGVAQFGGNGGGEGFIEAGEDRREQFSGAGQVFERADLEIKIDRPGRAEGKRVDFLARQAEEHIENERMQRSTEPL